MVIDDAIAIRPMCHITLGYDHRLVDGADAGRFLAFVKERLENFDEAWIERAPRTPKSDGSDSFPTLKAPICRSAGRTKARRRDPRPLLSSNIHLSLPLA